MMLVLTDDLAVFLVDCLYRDTTVVLLLVLAMMQHTEQQHWSRHGHALSIVTSRRHGISTCSSAGISSIAAFSSTGHY